MSLNVNPDTEARLLALAQASDVSVDDFLQHVVEEKSGQAPIGASSSLSPVEGAAAWRESVKGLPQTKPLSDEAISRESTGERPACELPPEDELPPEEWIREFDAWTESHAADNLPLLSDEAISREFIYAKRGL